MQNIEKKKNKNAEAERLNKRKISQSPYKSRSNMISSQQQAERKILQKDFNKIIGRNQNSRIDQMIKRNTIKSSNQAERYIEKQRNMDLNWETSQKLGKLLDNSPISVEAKISLSNSIGRVPSKKNKIFFEQRIGIVLNKSKNNEDYEVKETYLNKSI